MADWTLVGTNVSGTGSVLSRSLTIPAGAQAGDIAFAFFYWDDNTANTDTADPLSSQVNPPAGWTLVGYAEQFMGTGTVGRDWYLLVYYRILQAGDGGTTHTWTRPGSTSFWTEAALAVFRDPDGAVPASGTIEDSDFNKSTGTGTAIVCLASTAATVGALHVIIASSWSACTYAPPSGYTEAVDNASELAMAYKTLTATGSTSNQTYTASASDWWASASIIVAPPAGAAAASLVLPARSRSYSHLLVR